MSQTRYKHDCASCIYLGQHEDYDLYVHRNGTAPVYIARWGSDYMDRRIGQDNATHPALQTARRLAGERKS